jgi:hypothetical protein
MLPAKFGSILPSSFRGEDFFNISQSEKGINLGGHVCWPNGLNSSIKYNYADILPYFLF